MNDTQEKTKDRLAEAGDHDRFAHKILKSDWETGYLEGRPVVALCGKVWVPTRDPKRFPMCPECKEKYEAME